MSHLRTLIVAVLLSLPFSATAEIVFEGMFAIENDGKHTGYIIQRYEVDTAAKTRKITTYQRDRADKEGESDSYEVVRSVTGLDFSPIEFSRRSVGGGEDETIKASFKGKKILKVEAYSGGKLIRTDTMEVPRHSGLSSFAYYAWIARLPVGKSQTYIAFTESDGRYSNGMLRLDGSKVQDGVTVYQLQDFYAGEDIESFVFPDGSPAGSRNAAVKALVHLVPTREDAIKGMEFPQKDLIEIFGDLPEGQKNPVGAGGNKVDVKKLINSFPVAKPSRSPTSEEQHLTNPDLKIPVKPE